MIYKKNIFISILLLTPILGFCAPSIVYNFRIAQTTKQPIGARTHQKPHIFAGLLFNSFQKMKNFDVKENYTGGLVTYNYIFKEKMYIRADFAAAHVYQKAANAPNIILPPETNMTDSDDILLTIGRTFVLNKKTDISLSGLFGIPTHPIFTLQRINFGYGQFGIGLQLDGLYKLTNNIDFLWGTRYNYFIPRCAQNLEGASYRFTTGSIADILIMLQTSNVLSHGFEVGYDARWGFGVTSSPTIPNLDLLNYMRNTFYFLYKYTFLTERVAHRFMLNVSYGFDTKPKLYGFNAFTIWGSWGIAF